MLVNLDHDTFWTPPPPSPLLSAPSPLPKVYIAEKWGISYCYVYLNSNYISFQNQKGVNADSKMFRWEPEGRYCCTKSMAITSFWFSTEHCWTRINALLALSRLYSRFAWLGHCTFSCYLFYIFYDLSLPTAENLAKKWKITREQQDQFALSSQLKTEKAQTDGTFDAEIVGVTVKSRKAHNSGHKRRAPATGVKR